jgi:large repetitive protein
MTLRCRPLACVFLIFIVMSIAKKEVAAGSLSSAPRPASREQLRLREKWFRKGRTMPGRATAALRHRAQQQKFRQRAARARFEAFSDANNGVKPWVPLGPAPLSSNATGSLGEQDYGPVVGRATAVVVDPGDPTGNLVYVAGAYGGLWKSANAAAANVADVAWTPLLDDQATLAVGAIALKPTIPGVPAGVILVGTGEANNAPDSYYGLGILRSSDGGAHWTLITSANGGARPFRGLAFSKFAFSTSNPNLVVAAVAASNMGVTEDAENPQGTNRGLYYSTDAGATWSYATVRDGSSTISPSSVTSVVYAPASGLFFAAVRYHGVYLSANGATWQRLDHEPGTGLTLANCPTTTSLPSDCPLYRAETATLTSRKELYVWYVDGNDENQGIYVSKDDGESWTQISDAGILQCGDGPHGGCGTEQGSYNLALTAIPNGSATDLWAGAINLYKCTLNSLNSRCDVTPFSNLTHVYGCTPTGSLSHVHPNQHAMSFLSVAPSVVLYFVNDGGIYRTLNAYDPSFTGSCGGSNPFQNLNATMGSVTQFISFAQDAADRTTFLGGAQGNGFPATNSVHGSSWISVNGGDGGFSEINPASMDDWFTANSYVSIQRCSLGIDCEAQDFSTVVNSGTLGGDSSAFYMPYMLDPQASGKIIAGTCRVWRGNSDGTSFSALSFNFDDDTASTCTGEELNLVRSMAAGGTTTANGSQVIYAGTEAGRIFVTTHVDDGPLAWEDRTGAINPGNFPISSIALDPADATGRTAYVTIMGFGVAHVFHTHDAGGHWTNANGSGDSALPDAPANSIVVDPADAQTVYAGTDVGVFVSHDAGTSWAEMGPTSGAGMLPNVAVTRLRMFNAGGTVRLRASTYGRGLWETVLIAKSDFSLSIDDSELTIFAGQAGSYAGELTSLDGYSLNVSLTCSGGTLPSTCTPDPASLVPTETGAPFTVHVGGTPADYSFNIRGVGADSQHITHIKPVTLHVIDFGLTAPSPNSVEVNRGSVSPQMRFQAWAQGSFNANVTLSCIAIAGLTCNFSPSATVSPTAGHPVNIVTTVSAGTSTEVGTTTVTIQANTNGAPAPKTQLVTVVVKNQPDYNLSTSSADLFAMPGQQVTFPIILTPVNAYRGPVNVSCSTGTLGAPCPITPSGAVSLDPANLVNGSAAVNASFTVPGLASTSTVTIAISTSDATYGTPAHAMDITLHIGEFRIIVPMISQTIRAGETAHYELDYVPPNQAVSGTVTFTCGAVPPLSRCSFAPNGIPANTAATVMLSIATAAPVAALAPQPFGRSSILYAFFYLLPMGAVLMAPALPSRKRKVARVILMLVVISSLLMFPHCGGGGNSGGGGGPYVAPSQSGTPVGTYTVNITARSGTASRTFAVTLTVQ